MVTLETGGVVGESLKGCWHGAPATQSRLSTLNGCGTQLCASISSYKCTVALPVWGVGMGVGPTALSRSWDGHE